MGREEDEARGSAGDAAGVEGRLMEELVVEVAGLYGYRLTGVRWRDLAELVFLTQYVRGRHEEPTARAVRD